MRSCGSKCSCKCSKCSSSSKNSLASIDSDLNKQEKLHWWIQCLIEQWHYDCQGTHNSTIWAWQAKCGVKTCNSKHQWIYNIHQTKWITVHAASSHLSDCDMLSLLSWGSDSSSCGPHKFWSCAIPNLWQCPLVAPESECNRGYRTVRRRDTTVLRTRSFSSVWDLACTLNNIYLIKSCPYGMDFSSMTLLGFMLRIRVFKSWAEESRTQEYLTTSEMLLPH